jgi:hypothetical protein
MCRTKPGSHSAPTPAESVAPRRTGHYAARVSNPYGGNPYGNPGDQNPYGGPPYGGGPGAPQPAYGAPQPVKTDGVSIAALVCGVLGCLVVTTIAAIVLGFLGIGRTKNGQRKGRGFAIAGIVLGFLGLIGWVLVAVLVAFGASQVVSPGDAKVGQCVNLDNDSDSNTVLLTKADCTSDHDAEVVGIATVTSDNLADIKDQMTGYCPQVIDQADLAKLSGYENDLNAVIEDPNDVNVGDHLVCYIEAKRSSPIL